MNISVDDLQIEYIRSLNDWPFIHDIANKYGLPYCLLHAVGSRETNLRNIIGDGGHGHGVFQLDDRFHTIPPNFMSDVAMQAETAAKMLHDNYNRIGDWTLACNIYNSGSPSAQSTTGGDYGPDVMDRRSNIATLQFKIPNIPDMAYGQSNDSIKRLQTWLNSQFPLYSKINPITGYYGDQTTSVIKEFQRRAGIIGGDGRNVGPQTKAKLWEYGFRG